jgi:hypothetical protein
MERASFDIIEVATGYFYGPLDIVIVGDSIPHIVYHDHQATTFDLALGDQTHVFRPIDFWLHQPIADDGHDGWDNSIATFNEGVYSASIDPAQFGSTVGVEYWDGESVEAIGSGPVDYQFGTSIAMDAQGNPHISYFDFSVQFQKSETLKYATKQNGVWDIETVDDQPGGRPIPGDQNRSRRTARHQLLRDRCDIRHHTLRKAGEWRMED